MKFGGGSTSLHVMSFYRNLSLTIAPHYMPWTSKETLALEKLYCCFEVFFLLRILFTTLDYGSFRSVLFGVKFLTDLKMPSGLLECFAFVWFCIFRLPNIFQKVLVYLLYSSCYTGTKFCTFWFFTLLLM